MVSDSRNILVLFRISLLLINSLCNQRCGIHVFINGYWNALTISISFT